MQQKQIGEFIHQIRKEKGLTQKELADCINVSDKTVSKWENGNSAPDTTLLSALCEALDISVNELLSCKKLPPEDYSKKAEENIMSLLKDKENERKSSLISTIVGICLVVIGLLLNFGLLPTRISWFIDLPSLLLPAIYCIAAVLLCGRKSKVDKLHIARKVVIPSGIIASLSGLISCLGIIDDISLLGPNLAVSVLSILYCAIAYIVLYVIEMRIMIK